MWYQEILDEGNAKLKLKFRGEVAAVYNPLEYARAPYELYLKICKECQAKALCSMNPGLGDGTNRDPFGEVAAVRDWLGLEAEVDDRSVSTRRGQLKDLHVSGARFRVVGYGVGG